MAWLARGTSWDRRCSAEREATCFTSNTPANFAVSFVDGQGAVRSLGLTMHATSASQPTASFTLAGFSTADLASGKVSTVFGANGSEPYLNLHVS
jgi:hypothetical protein